ncbi:ceramidase domain-containing protein [Methyloligella sp. 2.7D]|uniref:ceramidase domain-containing protein n=1 Tax=unclassified Methyloligella TaxID=2625955 RepID=UPI00157CE07E|nr:ceramidase domain-containing protein [Methyloligella sp. GL2]QKP77268.1 ceramidase domain-containing protein [Methyloligella sp. GL2]
MGEHVYLYCERGVNPDLLAEPVNAATNAAFLLAALAGLWLFYRRPAAARSADHYLLIGLVFVIGLGSLSFHLFATEATSLADTIPIGLFVLVNLGFALNRLLGVPPGWTVLIVAGFAGLAAGTMQLRCFDGAIGFPGPNVTGASPCFNGSIAYFPALLAMAVIGALLWARKQRAGTTILWAALIFAISVTFRSLDLALCGTVIASGHKLGTHFLWHLLNALTLFLLLKASLEAGQGVSGASRSRAEILAPVPSSAPAREEEPEERSGSFL